MARYDFVYAELAVVTTKQPVSGPEPPFIRVEFQAPPDFLPALNRARKKRGLSKSAYLRQAAMLQIEKDLEAEPLPAANRKRPRPD